MPCLTPDQFNAMQNANIEVRLKYLCEQAQQQQQLWILTDEHGCVMLNTEDEDCVPVWPDQQFAQSWASGDWQDCQAEAISLKTWHERWTPGLQDDDLAVAVFPVPGEDGLVLSSYEFAAELKNQG